MLTTRPHTAYRAFGLTIASEFPLPELIVLADAPDLAGAENTVPAGVPPFDIEIVEADLVARYDKLAEGVNRFIVRKGLVLFRIPHAGIFAVENGRSIKVCPDSGADAGEIRLLILGTCMGAALMQRGLYPLHGSAVEIGGKAYAFIGESGAGKSTLASAFLNQGFRLLTDDVIPVSITSDSIPVVTPSYPQQKLWQESLDHFGVTDHRYDSIYGRHEKYLIPVLSSYCDQPLPLAGIFELSADGGGPRATAEPLGKLERIHTLFTHTYRNFLLPGLGLTEWHFGVSSVLALKTAGYRLRRPSGGFSAEELRSLVLQLIRTEGSP